MRTVLLSLLVVTGCTTAPPATNPINMVDNATLCQANEDAPITDGRLKTVLWNEVLRRARTGQMPKGLCSNYINPFPVIQPYIPPPPIVAKVNVPTENDEQLLRVEFAKEAALLEIREERDNLREYIRAVDEIDSQMRIVSPMW